MTHAMHHGVTLHSGTAIQEVNVKFTAKLNQVEGMVNGVTEPIAGYSHSHVNSGTVRGKGTLSLVPGFGSASVTGISGGLTHIDEVSQKEALGTESEFSYSFTHLPNAA